MPQPELRDTTQVFFIQGGSIQKSIQHRSKQHEGELAKCLDKVATLIKNKADGDYEALGVVATGAMLALVQDVHLTSDSVEVRAQLDRASYLTSERLDLLCIARNLSESTFYKVTLEEAKRYGLV